MQKIKTFLWFNDNAVEAVNFYISTFKNSKITSDMDHEGKVLVVNFELEGEEFVALNGGPHFEFTPAISLFVTCEDQAEVDDLWAKLLDGGKEMQCGWITDKFGLTWQIIPRQFMEMMSSGTPEQTARVMQSMMQMVKFDVPTLEKAYRGD